MTRPGVTDAVLLEAARRILPDVEGWQLDVQPPKDDRHPLVVVVYGDPSWLDWLPAAHFGGVRGSERVCAYNLGVAVLAVRIDDRPRGVA